MTVGSMGVGVSTYTSRHPSPKMGSPAAAAGEADADTAASASAATDNERAKEDMGPPNGVGGTATAAPRPGPPPLTDRHRALGTAWESAGPRLVRSLRRQGATEAQAQDVAQEVALRAVAREVPFDGVEDLLRWCNTVGRNLLVDQQRAAARHPTGALDDAARQIPDAADVHAQVESRLRLGQVLRAFHQLPEADQAALRTAAELGGPTPRSRTESTRLAVRRHRARVRLETILGGAVSALLGLIGRLRAPAKANWAAAAAVFPAALVFAATAPMPSAGSGQDPSWLLAPLGTAATEPPSAEAPATPGPAAPERDAKPTASSVRAAEPHVASTEVRPAPGVAVGTRTHPNPDKTLLCVDPGPPGTRTCVDRPSPQPVPSGTAAPTLSG